MSRRKKQNSVSDLPRSRNRPSGSKGGAVSVSNRFLAGWQQTWLLGLVLALLPLLAYWPVLHGEFLWDDDSWTTRLQEVFESPNGLVTLWTKLTAMQQYYPLSGSSFWLDYHLWGFHPLPYHVENILLHGLAAVLFWRLLKQMQVPGAWLAGAILALHPVMVESVGWITERKNVLSLPLGLGAMLCYGRVRGFGKCPAEPQPEREPFRWGWYLSALGLFLGALCGKTTVVCLPAVLLLLGWWKRRQIVWAEVLPLAPFFACATAMGLATAWVEKYSIGAQGPEWAVPFGERCLIAGRVFWFYLGKLFWPAHLCFVYPRWSMDPHSLRLWLWPASALGCVAGAWLLRRRLGWGLLLGLLVYVGSLFPVLGFLNPYFTRHSFVCDHWVYLSSLPIIALAASCGWQRLRRLGWGAWGLAAVLLVGLGNRTWQQCGMYRNNHVLWETTLRLNPRAWLAWFSVGNEHVERNETEQAVACFRRSLEINPRDEVSWNNLGYIALNQGRYAEAIEFFNKSLQAYPIYGEALMNLARVYSRLGQVEQAVVFFKKTLAQAPNYAPAWNEMGQMYYDRGNTAEAQRCYEKALQVLPEYPPALNNVGVGLLEKGQVTEAIGCFQRSLARRPGFAEAESNLGVALCTVGRLTEAEAHWRQALRSKPDYLPALKNLAWVLSTAPQPKDRNGAEAVRLALKASASGHSAALLQVLAAAYGEQGDFEEAVNIAREAIAQGGDAPMMASLRRQMQLYQNRQPFRDSFNGQ